jgi:predicted nucleic acid-binding protein
VIEDWRKRATSEMASESGVISALVLDELAYRLVLAWLRDHDTSDPLSTYRADPRAAMRAARRRLGLTWKAVDALGLELRSTDQPVVEQAKALMARPGLTPRDAFHAAHALAAECTVIVSSDETFDRIPGLRRLAP